jgi:preprotein translocase subunit YajC
MDEKLANDIKKGAVVTLKSGLEATVADNLRGMIRNLTYKVIDMDMTETGSSYIYDWDTVVIDGVTYKVTMTEKQAKQAKNIKSMMRSLRTW